MSAAEAGVLDRRRVTFDADGVPLRPVEFVDLERSSLSSLDMLRRELTSGAARNLVVGVASGAPSSHALDVLPLLTCSLVGELPSSNALCCVRSDEPVSVASAIEARVAGAPRAALILDGLLRVTASTEPPVALVAESLAYSALLGGPEFVAWRNSRPVRAIPEYEDPVKLERDGSRLDIVLSNPARRNAFDTRMRTAIADALRVPLADNAIERVVLRADGPDFSSGGDLDEFGTARDLAAAHSIRLDQSAGLGVHRVADRVVAELHGACIGAGIEVPAFARTVLASEDTYFRLPEFGFGLVPGAGGTVSVTRRIGRWRAAYLILSGVDLGFAYALTWGLVDGER